MILSSTTIQHQNTPYQASFKENRLVHVEWGKEWGLLKAQSKGLWGRLSSVYQKVRWLTGVPLITEPAKYIARKTWDGMLAVGDGMRIVAHTTRDATRGALRSTVGPLATWLQAPLQDLKMNFYDNSRDVIKGVLKDAPVSFVEGIAESGNNVTQHSRDTWSSLKSLKPLSFLNNSRKMITSALGAPFNPLWHVAKSLGGTGVKVGKNIVGSKMQYFSAAKEGVMQIREGAQELLHSPQTGYESGHVVNLDALKARREKSAKAEAKRQEIQAEIAKAKAAKKKETLMKRALGNSEAA
ncbi:hypothetical protein COY07_00845 [Candidatus Peregrinibacteria bacterium CG_4_10_14_0_2_um_filter_43_11]|nr:MAG: hypothetical protein COY07_00845 [Candidatus Peregrinibacteria bacterium CG_4_10_14_0_2_um_filter_43_11]